MLSTLKPMLLKTTPSFQCLQSMQHHFPCKSQWITFEVTERQDQHTSVVLLPTIAQHGFSRKKVTYLKLTTHSVSSLCENLWVGNCSSSPEHKVLCMQSLTSNCGTLFSEAVLARKLKLKNILSFDGLLHYGFTNNLSPPSNTQNS